MRVLRTLSVLLLLTFCANLWGSVPEAAVRWAAAHRAMHWIVTETLKDGAGCTATAIAPHALLTAEHCDLKDAPGAKLFIDRDVPKYAEATQYRITGKIYDGSDHMILLVSGPSFNDTIKYAPQDPEQSENVLWWGNPGGIHDQLREGYVMGQMPEPAPSQKELQRLWLVAAPAIPGDSGSAVIDATDGHLVGVVTYSINDGEFMGMFELHFTAGQIATAEAYGE